MSLRYRLFLWVALVFSITFITSFYMEAHITRVNLEKTYQELMKKLDELNKKKTKAIEGYLADMLYKIQAESTAVLQCVSKYELVRRGFEPTLANLEDYNWLNSSSLMITNKWIDYIQSTNENTLMSGIIIDANELRDTVHFPVHEHFHFVAIRDQKDPKKWSEPYIGIGLDISSIRGSSVSQKESDYEYYVFFTTQTLLELKVNIDLDDSLDLSINLLEPFFKWIELSKDKVFFKGFLDQIITVQQFLKKDLTIIPDNEQWDQMINDKLKTISDLDSMDYKGLSFFEDSGAFGRLTEERYYQKQVKCYVKECTEHYNKVGLIWGLSTLTKSELFGKDPLSNKAPVGMGTIDHENFCGKGLKSSSVFFDKPKYEVNNALERMKKHPSNLLTTHLDVIVPPGVDHVFFGNTLRLQEGKGLKKRTGYLTVGTDAGPVLGSLALATHRISLLASNNKIIKVRTPEGTDMEDREWYDIPIEKLLKNPSGIVRVSGKEYFFLHINSHERMDLHFFIFNTKEEEFALINSMNKGSKEVIRKLSLQTRLASVSGLLFVLIFLNGIAKRITKPITQLAGVIKTVAEGRLDDIEIPKHSEKGRHDEIYSLYHSFFEMLKGLREKERVRGVLNKVVSEEIAEEALKGNIQLGGEEKKVTVFFADIRGFIKMTEKMRPKEVIQLVNGCMTKASDKIDKYNGVIDKYVGDEVMALFGAPIEKKDSALSAIKSALETIEELKIWNVERKKQGLPEIKMGIGIHTGNVIAGNIGAENRLNYTVLGANVNLASRICSKAKEMQVLISEETLCEEDVENNFEIEKLQAVDLKGFTNPVNVYSVKSYKGKPQRKS